MRFFLLVRSFQKDLRIASAYGASLMAEKDLLIAEKEGVQQQCEAVKERLEEKTAELDQINATNNKLLSTLEDADGSMGGLTNALQVRTVKLCVEGRLTVLLFPTSVGCEIPELSLLACGGGRQRRVK